MEEVTRRALARSRTLLERVVEVEEKRQESGVSLFEVNDIASRAANLIHGIAGSRSAYAENLRAALKHKAALGQFLAVAGVVQAFHLDLGEGNLRNLRHEVEAVVVSEIIDQAKKLLRTKGVHPAPAVIVACAGVEEFLRNWCVEQSISIPEKQRSISRFAAELRAAGQISLPVERRVQSWADYRNDAAHGDKWSSITPEIAQRLVKEVEDFILENRHVLGA
jgi:hypothetical protein